MRHSSSALLLSVLALSACATKTEMPPVDRTRVEALNASVPDAATITARLAEAAQRTADAVENLSSIEQARTPELYSPVVNDAPPELRLLVTVQWTGPWENLVKVMAERVNYDFRVIGKSPPTPVVVTVDARQQPYVDVIRNIGLQAAGRADLVLDSQNKVVEIRYAPDTGR
jgi:defect-in-organelle-trafficking protein DotD